MGLEVGIRATGVPWSAGSYRTGPALRARAQARVPGLSLASAGRPAKLVDIRPTRRRSGRVVHDSGERVLVLGLTVYHPWLTLQGMLSSSGRRALERQAGFSRDSAGTFCLDRGKKGPAQIEL
jgi:hypothetical protein